LNTLGAYAKARHDLVKNKDGTMGRALLTQGL